MDIENFSTNNLREAKKQFIEEKNNAEIVYAKTYLKEHRDKIDSINRQIAKLVEDRNKLEEELKVFR